VVPKIVLYQRQRRHRCDLKWLRATIARAMPLCLAQVKGESPSLPGLPEIEASIVTDKVIGEVHAEFLADPTPTDVITFHHGEILVSADTAARAGPAHGLSLDEELLLYLIHGLLHLGGWDDHDPEEAAEMKKVQEGILMQVKRGK
jgi:probable rRNA maturation factor